jgi:hypothetical protein
MSERNGDRARFGRERRQKILRRRLTRESREALEPKATKAPPTASAEK